jgi:hypothetical protein
MKLTKHSVAELILPPGKTEPAIGTLAKAAIHPFAGGVVLKHDHGVAEFVGRQARRGIRERSAAWQSNPQESLAVIDGDKSPAAERVPPMSSSQSDTSPFTGNSGKDTIWAASQSSS